ncbi:MAG: response regulator [Spirochaetota bacterium]
MTQKNPSSQSFEELKGGNESILVVEDEEIVRTMISTILENFGYEVIGADSGKQAIDIYKNHHKPIHLLITDVVMPGMNGRLLAEKLMHRNPELKVLYISGYTEDAIIHHGVLDRETPFLKKPFDPGTLARKVREILDGK